MAITVTPRVAKIHLNTSEAQYRIGATALEFNGTRYTPEELIKFAATLADIITALIDFWGAMDADAHPISTMPAGDMHALAAYITAKYPAGYIPAATPLV